MTSEHWFIKARLIRVHIWQSSCANLKFSSLADSPSTSSHPQQKVPWLVMGWSQRPRLVNITLVDCFSGPSPICSVCSSLRGYLMRPSFLTGPSSDLGSGDKELQEVLVQSPMVEQEEVTSEQRSPVTQKAPTELSTQASSGFPTRVVFFCASCRAGSLGGSFNTLASCWKLCSKYTLPGGPPCTQPWSSKEEKIKSVN